MDNSGIKKTLSLLTDKHRRTVWVRAFRLWQRRPHEVAPLTDVTHICASCATQFTGNFCPRCGQSATVGRFSFKKALLLFFDVWGMGNRSMFRSIRDLMLRPGYMIRDYLSGMQSAYFPPFKMFFLLTAFSLLLEHGLKISEPEPPQTKIELSEEAPHFEESERAIKLKDLVNKVDALRDKYPAIFSLMMLILFSSPLYVFMRRSPTIPNLRYSELVVALVYTSNTYSIYSSIGEIIGSRSFDLVALIMIFVTLRQFSGYSKKRLLLYFILTFIITIAVIASLFMLVMYLIK